MSCCLMAVAGSNITWLPILKPGKTFGYASKNLLTQASASHEFLWQARDAIALWRESAIASIRFPKQSQGAIAYYLDVTTSQQFMKVSPTLTKQYIEQRDEGYWLQGTRISLDSVVYAFLDGE